MRYFLTSLLGYSVFASLFLLNPDTLAAKGSLLAAIPPASDTTKHVFGSPTAKRGGILYYTHYEPNHLNPITHRGTGAREVLVKWVFESLLDYNPITYELIPRLARKWTVSDDGKTFVFWLDKRAKWADGSPVTAQDVAFSFNVFAIKGVRALPRKASLDNFVDITVLEDNRIQFVADKPYFKNLHFLASTLIVPRRLFQHDSAKKINKNKYTRKPSGSGPYKVQKWTKGKQLVLTRNPNYWGTVLPQNHHAYNFDKIIIKYIRDPQMAFELLKKGKLDYMRLWIDQWKQSKSSKAFTTGKLARIAVANKIPQGFGYIAFNHRRPLFKDLALRKAIYQAINRQEMIRKSLDGLAVVPRGPLYSFADYEGSFQPPPYDLNAVKKKLTELGWTDSDGDYILDKKGKALSFQVIVPNPRILKELLFIQEGVKKIGIDMRVKQIEWNSFVKLLNEHNFDAFANGKNRNIIVDPYNEFHSNNRGKGQGNIIGYTNTEVDRLIERGRAEMDRFKRKAIFTKVNDHIANDFAIAQWSEIKYAFIARAKNVKTAQHNNRTYLPYTLGMKYWYK